MWVRFQQPQFVKLPRGPSVEQATDRHLSRAFCANQRSRLPPAIHVALTCHNVQERTKDPSVRSVKLRALPTGIPANFPAKTSTEKRKVVEREKEEGHFVSSCFHLVAFLAVWLFAVIPFWCPSTLLACIPSRQHKPPPTPPCSGQHFLGVFIYFVFFFLCFKQKRSGIILGFGFLRVFLSRRLGTGIWQRRFIRKVLLQYGVPRQEPHSLARCNPPQRYACPLQQLQLAACSPQPASTPARQHTATHQTRAAQS